MKFKFLLLLIILTGISVAACSSSTSDQPVLVQSTPSQGEQPGQSESPIAPTWNQATQMDEQGAVVVEATPLNLNMQEYTLEFEVVLDTHSVDLGMDLTH